MSKRWFTPSFESAASSASEIQSRSKQRRKDKTAKSGLQRKTGDGCRRAIDSAARIAIKNNGDVDVLNKYAPETPDDLVVHVKKVDQVRTWICDHISNKADGAGKYVLLHGPSGSGKSSTFRVLAKSLNVKIIEWITPIDREWLANGGDSDPDDNGSDNRSTFRGGGAESFDNFLWRASRYSSLLGIDGEQRATPFKIILVKDFPHTFVQNPDSFHDLLRKYRSRSTYPMAFVCNDDSVCRTLFPDSIRDECEMQAIGFNPVNCTAVTKALKRVLDMERRLNPTLITSLPDDVNLQTFHQQSAGDLRCALLKFYFSIIKSSPPPSSSSQDIAAIEQRAGVIKDHHGGSDLFKILGRILYCKKEGETQSATEDDYKFVHDPEQLVRGMSDRPQFFLESLQENYVSRFQDLLGIAAVADSLCVADVMFKHCRKDNRDTATADLVALSSVVRRVMVSNRRPKKTFAPIVRSRRYDSGETFAARFSRSLRSVSLQFQYSSAELVLHVLPFARAIPASSSPDFNFQQHLQRFAATIGNGGTQFFLLR